jgi:hypothetical protein
MAPLIFGIGNSLTNDTIPSQWSSNYTVRPSSGLLNTYNNPTTNLAGESVDWSVAFANTQYDIITVQPYPPDTVAQNLTVIGSWVTQQTSAKFIIHTGWPGWASHNGQYRYAHTLGTNLVWTPAYYENLLSQLRANHPGRDFAVNPAVQANELIYQDILRGVGPFSTIQDLYRDTLHVSNEGRYLQNNVMRRTLGLPLTTANSSTFSTAVRSYLDSKVQEVEAIAANPTITTNGKGHFSL